MDGRNESVRQKPDSDEEAEEEVEEEEEEADKDGHQPQWHSTTDPVKPLTTDGYTSYTSPCDMIDRMRHNAGLTVAGFTTSCRMTTRSLACM
jgi:hypothetical protein